MTQHIDPNQPSHPAEPMGSAWPPVPAPARPGRKLSWLWVLGILVAFGAGLSIGLVSGHGQGGATSPTARAQRPLVVATTTAPPSTFATTTTTEPPEPPSASDFTISITVLSKECFGSAGCNITYRIKPTYDGRPLASDETYTITYQVTGVEDGPQINSFTMTGDQVEYDSEELAQTSSSGAKLSAKVTTVSQG